MADRRAIRVFVSSTFRDMQAERDELVKRTFPQLRRLCEQRGVAWSEVDLRWGVTDEQAAEGAVLPICLAEIERTRPYFIGLLGQRYGWVPDTIPADLAAQLGWLADEAGKSVTELEILHGVLNDPEAEGHAFFYLRDPAWVATVPEAERATFLEPTPEGVARLDALRARVRGSGFPVADYADPTDLGAHVLADFTALIDRLYPPDRAPDALARTDAVHAAFGQARFGLYVPRPALAEALDAGGSPLLVTGAPGGGASALVTNWVAGQPGAIVHHCDADTAAGDFRQLAARVIAHLGGGAYDDLVERLAGETVGGVAAALAAAARAWHRPSVTSSNVPGTELADGSTAPTGGARHVVVLDGVDRLADVDRAPDLRWLPAAIADTDVRFVVTGSGQRARDAFALRGWPVLEVPPLAPDERRAIATHVLAVGAKTLDPAHLDALVAAPATGNPRFLRTVLDELRQHGEHFTLRALIDRLTAAPTVDDLLELVLARYEADFEGDRPGLVGDTMRALWAARHGLAEAELLDLLAPGPDHLPQRVWAPLHLAAAEGIVSRGGLLGFAHPDLRQAVEDRYLPTPESRTAAHATLAGYFAERYAADGIGPRVADELAWQHALAGDHPALRSTLSDLVWAEAAYTRNPVDLRRLWARLGPLTSVADELRAAYAPVLADPAAHDGPGRQLVWGVARLLADAGALDPALTLQRYLATAAAADQPGGPRHVAALVNVGASELARGDRDAAAATFTTAATLAEQAGDTTHHAAAIGNLAVARTPDPSADALFAQADTLYRAAGNLADVQANLGGWANLRRAQGDYAGALRLLEQQEALCRELGDPIAIGRALAGQAVVLADQGQPALALEKLDTYAAVAQAEGDLRGLAEARLNAAITRGELADSAGAAAAASEAEQLARQLGDPDLLARVLLAQATSAGAAGDWPRAEQVAREAELTARSVRALAQAAQALGIAGTARREQGDLAGCRAAHTAEAQVAGESGDPLAVATAQANLGNLAIAEQRYDTALDHYAAAEPTLRRVGSLGLLVPVLANRAQIHQMHQRWPQALADYTDAAEAAAAGGNTAAAGQWAQPGLQIAYQVGDTAAAERLWAVQATVARAAGDQAVLQQALGERALMMINRGAHTEATALLDEQEQICRAIGHTVGLAACVGNRAIVLRYQGDYEGALRALDEQHAIGDAQAQLFATANRGEVLGLMGRTAEARAALQAARATAQQYGLHPMVQQLDQMIAGLQ